MGPSILHFPFFYRGKEKASQNIQDLLLTQLYMTEANLFHRPWVSVTVALRKLEQTTGHSQSNLVSNVYWFGEFYNPLLTGSETNKIVATPVSTSSFFQFR